MAEIFQARSALDTSTHDAPRTHGDATVVHLAERRIDDAFTLRFDESDAKARARANAHTGLLLDGSNRGVSTKRGTAIWLGPGNWLVMPASEIEVSRSAIAAPDPLCTAIDTSDLWSALRLHGARSRNVLAKGCEVDLDSRRFPHGTAAVTRLARIRALIHHVDPSPVFDIYVERSYAVYMWVWLVEAMSEFLNLGE